MKNMHIYKESTNITHVLCLLVLLYMGHLSTFKGE
jgi:hypothetical protein